MPRCRAPIAVVLPILILTLARVGLCQSRPDQVLVLYNADWQVDQDGSDPGQDSEEIARYYVRARTDPVTGRKPFLLGLSAGGGADSPLNQPVLREGVNDNLYGLVTRDGHRITERLPFNSDQGDTIVPFRLIEAGAALPRYAAIYLRQEDIPRDAGTFRLIGRQPEKGEIVFGTWSRSARDTHPSVFTIPVNRNMIIAVDLSVLGEGAWTFELSAEGAGGSYRLVGSTAEFSRGRRGIPTFVPVVWGEGPRGARVPDRTAAFPKLLTAVDLIARLGNGQVSGLRLPSVELADLVPESIALTLAPAGREGSDVPVYAAADDFLSAGAALWRLSSGDLIVAARFSSLCPGIITAVWSGTRRNGAPFRRELRLYPPGEVLPSTTGPDGIRDDRNYLDLIEGPVRAFLQANRTDDGIPLIDHILYIVVIHGLPYQVRSSYGIARGLTNLKGGDVGAGSALGQRLMMIHYGSIEPLRPPVIMNLGPTRDGFWRPILIHPLRYGLFGSRFNPMLHPLAFRTEAQKKALAEFGPAAVLKGISPPLTTELMKSLPPGRRLLAVTRIDAGDVGAARNQIDGALYGERYLTPGLGSAYCGPHQAEAPLIDALVARGFEVNPLGQTSDRALFYLGAGASGLKYQEDLTPGNALTPVWEKGFLPGSVGYAIKSFLGWDRHRRRAPVQRLFEQIIQNGVTASAGSAGGAHDTNLTWPDPFVLVQLLLEGYEYGDAVLRSLIYLDWTISVVGDPLYRPDQSRTTPDTTKPEIAGPGAVTLTVVPAGPGAFALQAVVTLADSGAEMAEIEIECTPRSPSEGETVIGRNTRFSRRPDAWAYPLRPARTYAVRITLTDPYGNSFTSTRESLPLLVSTGPSPVQKTLKHGVLKAWRGKDTLRFGQHAVDQEGELEIRFTVGKERKLPSVYGTGRNRLLHDGRWFQVGGSTLDLSSASKGLVPGSVARLLLRWRRRPVTREAWLIARDGSRHLISAQNRAAWDPGNGLGTRLQIESKSPVLEITFRDNPAFGEGARKTALPSRFNGERYRLANE